MMPSVRRLLAPFILALGCLLGATGCATLNPDVGAQMVDIRLGESRTLETSGEVIVRLTNRGSKEVKVEGASIKVYINGELIGEGVTGAPLSLAAFSTQEVPLQVNVNHLTLATRIGPMMETGVFLYRIDGKLHQKGWLPPITVSTTGQLDLRRLERKAKE